MNQNGLNIGQHPHSRKNRPFQIGETCSTYEATLAFAKGKTPSEAPPTQSANTYTPHIAALTHCDTLLVKSVIENSVVEYISNAKNNPLTSD